MQNEKFERIEKFEAPTQVVPELRPLVLSLLPGPSVQIYFSLPCQWAPGSSCDAAGQVTPRCPFPMALVKALL